MKYLLAHFRAWLVGDVYVVMDCDLCVGVSAKQQGAELLRADHARELAALADGSEEFVARVERMVYNRQRIENHELQDAG